jgi:hypothetical protein
MPFAGLTNELNKAPSLFSIARFNESIKVITCGSVQTFAETADMGVAAGVSTVTSVAIGGIGEGVSVVIKTRGAAVGSIGVGSVVAEKLQPVNRNNPTSRVDVSLMFIIVSSSMTIDNYIPCHIIA